jgi:hypothetical protein
MRAAVAEVDAVNIEPHGMAWLQNQDNQLHFAAIRENAIESAQIQDLQFDQQIISDSSQIPGFNQMVKGQLKLKNRNSPKKDFSCPTCQKSFRADWLLKEHQRDSHKRDSQMIREFVDGEYPCRMCGGKFENKLDLKRHVFNEHSETDVKVAFGQSIERYIGLYEMTRMRSKIFTSIRKGTFTGYIESILNKKKIFNSDNITYHELLRVDPNNINKEKRKLLYLKKTDLLKKLAHAHDEEVKLGPGNLRDDYKSYANQIITWDLRKNFDLEGHPDQTIRAIQYSQRVLKSELSYLPSYVDFYR